MDAVLAAGTMKNIFPAVAYFLQLTGRMKNIEKHSSRGKKRLVGP
jgi:hypothetical protein